MSDDIAIPASLPASAKELADMEGVDLSLIEDALLRTPEERLRENSRALRTIEALRKALNAANAGT
jgi:hypothetical protein